jgi:hypothetical protein
MQFHMKLVGAMQLPAGVRGPDDFMAVAQALLDYSPMENKNALAGQSGSKCAAPGTFGCRSAKGLQQRWFTLIFEPR